MRVVSAFSLVELLIVISIIGILAAVAVPVYRDYTLRAKVSGAVTIVTSLNSQVGLDFSKTSTFPTYTDPSAYVRSPYIFGYATLPENGHTCKAGTAYAYINNYVDGPNVFQTGSGRGLLYINYIIESPSGILETYCLYYENVDGNLGADANLVSNCAYGTDPTPEITAALDAC